MTSVDLVVMPSEIVASYLERSLLEAGEDIAIASDLGGPEALELARADRARFLPEGPGSPGHAFQEIVAADLGPVGMLWTRLHGDPPARNLWIYDFRISPEFRGRGLGMQALEAVENLARELGANHIRLHVFGHNERARSLYCKAGFEATNVFMRKRVEGVPR